MLPSNKCRHASAAVALEEWGPLVLYAVAAVVRLGGWLMLPHLDMNSDFYLYERVAVNLLHGDGYVRSPGGPLETALVPGYPIFIAFSYAVFGKQLVWVRLLQVLLGATMAPTAFHLGKRLFTAPAGALAGLLVGLYPIFIILPLRGYSENLYLPLFLLFMLTYLSMLDGPTLTKACVAGCVLGLVDLIRPVGLLLPVALLPGMLLGHWRPKVHSTKCLAVLALSTALVISPWIVRLWMDSHRFIPLASHNGQNFFRATYADQLLWDATARSRLLEEHIDEIGARDVPLREWDRTYYPAGMKRIVKDPGAYLRLLPAKFIRFWYMSDTNSVVMPLIACQSVVIWPGLLAIGWHLKRRWLNDGRILAVLGIISYLIAVSILVSYPIARMSLPIVPLLLVLIAGAGWELSLRRGCEMEHLAKHD